MAIESVVFNMQEGNNGGKEPMKFLLAFLCVGALLFPTWGEAATYYVNKAGDDASSCATATSATDSNAKLTFAAGVVCADTAGDTLIVGDGTYDELVSAAFANSGSDGSPITYRAENRRLTTITYSGSYGGNALIQLPSNRSYLTFDGFILDLGAGTNKGRVLAEGQGGVGYVHHIILNDMEFDGNGTIGGCVGMDLSDKDDINSYNYNSETTNSYIHDCGGEANGFEHGIYINGNDNLAAGNVIEMITNGVGTGGAGIQVSNDTNPPQRNIIRNNTISGADRNGINVGGIDNEVYNNILFDNLIAGVRVVNVGGDDLRNLVYNNTIYNNGAQAVRIITGTDTGIRNNIFWNNDADSVTDGGTNTIISNNTTADPKFVDAAGDDFSLLASSPAIGAGLDLSGTFTVDFNFDTRDLPWDTGAIGYDLGGAPSPDLTLTITDPLTAAKLTWAMADEADITKYCIYVRYAGEAIPGPRFYCIPTDDTLINKDGTGSFNLLSNSVIILRPTTTAFFRVAPWTTAMQDYGSEDSWDNP